MLREKCNRPMLLIERQRAILLEVYKCIHELGPRYRNGVLELDIPIGHHVHVPINHKPRKNGILLAMIRLITIS